jgi:hypothetical protein
MSNLMEFVACFVLFAAGLCFLTPTFIVVGMWLDSRRSNK